MLGALPVCEFCRGTRATRQLGVDVVCDSCALDGDPDVQWRAAADALAAALLTEAYGGAVCRVCEHHYNDENTCCDCAYFDEGPNV